ERRSDLHPLDSAPLEGDGDVVTDPVTGESLRVIDLEATHLAPGQDLLCSLGLLNFLRTPYSVRAYAEAMESDDYLDRALARIEAARQQILAHPGSAPSGALELAANAAGFAEAALENGWVSTGLVTAAERDAYRTTHGGLVT